MPVAIKTLKKEESTTSMHGVEPEIMKEARLMKVSGASEVCVFALSHFVTKRSM